MQPTAKEAWNACLKVIRDNIESSSDNPTTFVTWFEPIKPLELDQVDSEVRLTVELPSHFFYEWLEEHFYHLIRETVTRVLGPDARLYYKIIIAQPAESAPSESSLLRAQPQTVIKRPAPDLVVPNAPVPLPASESRLSRCNTFDNFVEGDCNRLARSAALAIAQDPEDNSFSPFLVYGGVGLGKTHLIQAIGNHVLANHTRKRVRYVTSEHFLNEFVQSIEQHRIGQFSAYYRSIDVLIVDDVQFFGKKEKIQEMFFHVFNELHHLRKQIILSADRPPKDIKGIEERLLSRFQWGLAADVQIPDLETRMAILNRKAADEGLDLPQDVTDFIARNIKSNIRELEGALVRLMTHATLLHDEINAAMARQALKDFIHDQPTHVTIDYIVKIVCDYFKLNPDLVRAKTRKREVVQARQIAMFFARELTQNSLKTIGLQFGGRDHSTVVHSERSVNNQMETNSQYREMMVHIRRSLIANPP